MDSRHTSALPRAAWRPSLLPQPGAAPRRGQSEPVRLLAALRQDLPMAAGVAAVSGLQSCLASLAALSFAGLGVALLLHWTPFDGAPAARPAHGAAPAAWAQQPPPQAAEAAAAQPAVSMPAAARIERPAMPQADLVPSAPMASSATLASAAITPTPGPRAASSTRAATARPVRRATASRPSEGSAATAAASPLPQALASEASTRTPQADGDGAPPPRSDADAQLLQAVLEWHEQHAPPPAPRR